MKKEGNDFVTSDWLLLAGEASVKVRTHVHKVSGRNKNLETLVKESKEVLRNSRPISLFPVFVLNILQD